ncbi:sporulation membrane protein YtaF [Paenibacillus marinisediminis]
MESMIPVVSMIVLAFALSLDSFGVGMTYGIRRMRMPWISVLVIAFCSGLVLYLSMQVGSWLMTWISPAFASRCGALILIGIGLLAIVQFVRSSSGEELEKGDAAEAADSCDTAVDMDPTPVLQVQLRRLGIIVQILRTPAAADIDRSGTISASEAAWLGAALSLDAFGAGIGAAMIGYPPLWTASFIAIFSGAFLKLGLKLGTVFAARWSWMRKLSFLPGCVLVLMGILKLL